MVESVLGFMPADIRRAEAELKLMLEQLLGLESCKDYVKTSIQTLDGYSRTSTTSVFTVSKRS